MRLCLGAIAFLCACVHASPPARACSFAAGPDTGFRLHEAPVGGVWWVRGVDARFTPDALPLIAENGDEVLAEIVTLGAQGTAAVRVPDAAVGASFRAPETVSDVDLAFGEARLVVTAGAAPAFDAPPEPPSISVEDREVRVGYVGVVTVPFPLCTAGGEYGLWNYHFDERPFLIVNDPGDDVVLDVQLQPPDEAPFDDVESANEILFDGRIAAAIDEMIQQPPDTTDTFSVHARVRRIADGVASEIVSVDVAVDDVPPEERLSCVGCTCGATSASGVIPFALALIALAAGNGARRRRRRHP